MKRKQQKKQTLHCSPLIEASTDALLAELKRRSVGLVVGLMGIDERGDFWRFESKGSQSMVESLFFSLEDKFIPDTEGGETIGNSKR